MNLSKWPLLLSVTFIPRRRYIYICPRVHLILLIFIIRGFFYLWVTKLWFQKQRQILLLWNAENFYLVTIFGGTIFEITKEIPVKLKSHCWDDFFQKWSPTPPSKGVFLRPNFMVDFFLFRIIFKGISFVKLKVSSIFWWTFFLVRLIFKGIS